VQEAKAIVADAIQFSEDSPLPDPATAVDGVTAIAFDAKGPAQWAS
jgi:hypothetical protein